MLYNYIEGIISKRVHKLLHIPPFALGQKPLLLSYRKMRSMEQKSTKTEYKLPQKGVGEIKRTSQHTASLDAFIREN